jgi:hypothetical protein
MSRLCAIPFAYQQQELLCYRQDGIIAKCGFNFNLEEPRERRHLQPETGILNEIIVFQYKSKKN